MSSKLEHTLKGEIEIHLSLFPWGFLQVNPLQGFPWGFLQEGGSGPPSHHTKAQYAERRKLYHARLQKDPS